MGNEVRIKVVAEDGTMGTRDIIRGGFGTAGADAGKQFSTKLDSEMGKGSQDAAKKATDQVKKQSQDGGKQAGGLMASALSAGLLAGGPVLVAGAAGLAGTALIAIGAKLQAGSPELKASWTKLGADANSTFTQASTGMVKPLAAAMSQIDGLVKNEAPTFRDLFNGAAADIGPLTGGLISLAKNALPGLDDAVTHSHEAMAGLASLMGDVGTAVGTVLHSVAANSGTAGSALASLGGIVKSIGSVLGSALTLLTNVGSGALPVLGTAVHAVAGAFDGLVSVLRPVEPLLGGVGASALVAFGAFKTAGAIASGVETLATKIGLVATAEKEAAATAGGEGGGLAGALGSLSKYAGPAGIAIGAAAGLVTLFMQAEKGAAPATYDNSQAVQSLSQAYVDAYKNGQTLSDEQIVQQVTASGAGKALADAGVSAGVMASTLHAGAGAVQMQIDALTQQEATLKNADSSYTQVSKTGSQLTEATQNQIRALQNQKAAWGDLLPEIQQARDAAQKQEDMYNAVNSVAPIASSNTETLAAAMTTLGDHSATATDQVKAMVTAIDDWSNGLNKANDAASAFYTALDALTPAQERGKGAILDATGALNEQTKAGRDVTSALDSAQQGALDYAQAQAAAGKSTQDVATGLAGMQDQLTATLVKMGLNKDQAAALTAQYLGVPQNIATLFTDPGAAAGIQDALDLKNRIDAVPNHKGIEISAPTQAAQRAIEDLGYDVINLPNGNVRIVASTAAAQGTINKFIAENNGRTITTYVNSVTGAFFTPGGSHGNATGGVIGHAAEGGPRMGTTIINELGQEAVSLPVGSTVWPHANAMAMARDTPATGQQPVHVTIGGPSGGTPVDVAMGNFIVEMVRTGKIPLFVNGQRVTA